MRCRDPPTHTHETLYGGGDGVKLFLRFFFKRWIPLFIFHCHWSLLCLMCKDKRVCAPTFAEARLQSCGRHQAIPHHYCTHLLQFSHLKKGKKWKDACQFNKYRRDVNKLLKYDLWLIPFWPESIILITLVPYSYWLLKIPMQNLLILLLRIALTSSWFQKSI